MASENRGGHQGRVVLPLSFPSPVPVVRDPSDEHVLVLFCFRRLTRQLLPGQVGRSRQFRSERKILVSVSRRWPRVCLRLRDRGERLGSPRDLRSSLPGLGSRMSDFDDVSASHVHVESVQLGTRSLPGSDFSSLLFKFRDGWGEISKPRSFWWVVQILKHKSYGLHENKRRHLAFTLWIRSFAMSCNPISGGHQDLFSNLTPPSGPIVTVLTVVINWPEEQRILLFQSLQNSFIFSPMTLSTSHVVTLSRKDDVSEPDVPVKVRVVRDGASNTHHEDVLHSLKGSQQPRRGATSSDEGISPANVASHWQLGRHHTMVSQVTQGVDIRFAWRNVKQVKIEKNEMINSTTSL